MDQEQQPSVWPPAPAGMTPMPEGQPFKPAPALLVMLLIGCTVVFSFLSAMLDFVMMHGGVLADANFTQLTNAVSTFQSCLQLAAFIGFLVWFYRVYKNLYWFGMTGLPYTKGWAVAWFFVPIMNLYQPYKMAQTIWKGSSPNLRDQGPVAWKQARSGVLVAVWWGFILVSQVAIAMASADVYQSHSLGRRYYEGMAVGNWASVLAGMTTMVLIRAVSRRQKAKAALLDASVKSLD